MKKKSLFVMTFGMSLSKWKEHGSIDREILPIKFLYSKFESVSVLTFGNSGKEESEILKENGIDATVLRLPKIYNNFSVIGYFISFSLVFIYCFKNKFDIILTNQLYSSFALLPVRLFNPNSKIILRYGFDPLLNIQRFYKKNIFKMSILKLFWKFQNRLSYLCADTVIVTHADILEFAQNKYSNKTIPSFVCPNWISPSFLNNIPAWSSRKDQVVVTGRLVKSKNIDRVIDLCSKWHLKLVIAGDGPERTLLQEYAVQSKVEAIFLGQVASHEVATVLKESKYYASFSLFEGAPKSTIEALSVGCLCLLSDLPTLSAYSALPGVFTLTECGRLQTRDGVDFSPSFEYKSGEGVENIRIASAFSNYELLLEDLISGYLTK